MAAVLFARDAPKIWLVPTRCWNLIFRTIHNPHVCLLKITGHFSTLSCHGEHMKRCNRDAVVENLTKDRTACLNQNTPGQIWTMPLSPVATWPLQALHPKSVVSPFLVSASSHSNKVRSRHPPQVVWSVNLNKIPGPPACWRSRIRPCNHSHLHQWVKRDIPYNIFSRRPFTSLIRQV